MGFWITDNQKTEFRLSARGGHKTLYEFLEEQGITRFMTEVAYKQNIPIPQTLPSVKTKTSPGPSIGKKALQAEIESLKTQLKTALASPENQAAKIDQLESNLKSIRKRLLAVTQEKNRQSIELRDTNTNLAAAQKALKTATTKQAELQVEKRELEKQLNLFEQIKAASAGLLAENKRLKTALSAKDGKEHTSIELTAAVKKATAEAAADRDEMAGKNLELSKKIRALQASLTKKQAEIAEKTTEIENLKTQVTAAQEKAAGTPPVPKKITASPPPSRSKPATPDVVTPGKIAPRTAVDPKPETNAQLSPEEYRAQFTDTRTEWNLRTFKQKLRDLNNSNSSLPPLSFVANDQRHILETLHVQGENKLQIDGDKTNLITFGKFKKTYNAQKFTLVEKKVREPQTKSVEPNLPLAPPTEPTPQNIAKPGTITADSITTDVTAEDGVTNVTQTKPEADNRNPEDLFYAYSVDDFLSWIEQNQKNLLSLGELTFGFTQDGFQYELKLNSRPKKQYPNQRELYLEAFIVDSNHTIGYNRFSETFPGGSINFKNGKNSKPENITADQINNLAQQQHHPGLVGIGFFKAQEVQWQLLVYKDKSHSVQWKVRANYHTAAPEKFFEGKRKDVDQIFDLDEVIAVDEQ